VVLATGAPGDKRLGIPGMLVLDLIPIADDSGSNLIGVYSARDFVGWYNGDPQFVSLQPVLDHHSAVVWLLSW